MLSPDDLGFQMIKLNNKTRSPVVKEVIARYYTIKYLLGQAGKRGGAPCTMPDPRR
jgi:hypothetical protein